MTQVMIPAEEDYLSLAGYLKNRNIRKLLLVCGNSLRRQRLNAFFEKLPEREIAVARFSDFEPNPEYRSIVAGVRSFQKEQCDAVVAVGGGSAMDVAKCIKLYAKESLTEENGEERDLLSAPKAENGIPLIAVPTTAGTGSEATRFAVIYRDGVKLSVDHDSILPEAVMLDAGLLSSLPDYQRHATMLDALCHSIESFWAVHSTEESREYAIGAVSRIVDAMEAYLANTPKGNEAMLKAAYQAGQAINLSKTTAGHAMCYRLTTKYHIAHGHAAALCVSALWPYMKKALSEDKGVCTDARGPEYLKNIFDELERHLTAEAFTGILHKLQLTAPEVTVTEEDYEELAASVNPERLSNHPVRLDHERLLSLYHQILES